MFNKTGSVGSYALSSSSVSLFFNGQVKATLSMDTEGKVTVTLN